MDARIGISPIAWWNDDLPELSEDIPLEDCLRQAGDAGFTGMETGRRFPMDAKTLSPILDAHNISVCGGWFSGQLLGGDIEAEKDRIAEQMNLFKTVGAPCIVYGEIAHSIQGDRSKPLTAKPVLSEEEIKIYGRNMTVFGEWCAEQGMAISYHHHIGAVIETAEEIDLLMRHSGDALPLLLDTGHLVLAGGDVSEIIDKHHRRISHVHAKDVRWSVMESLVQNRESFLDAVVKGVFTVPGDGSLSFEEIANRLFASDYEGWFVVEAEQDPKIKAPHDMAILGYRTLSRALTSAGYILRS